VYIIYISHFLYTINKYFIDEIIEDHQCIILNKSNVNCDKMLVERWQPNNYHKPELYPPGGTRLAFFCSGAGSDWAETCWAGTTAGLAAS